MKLSFLIRSRVCLSLVLVLLWVGCKSDRVVTPDVESETTSGESSLAPYSDGMEEGLEAILTVTVDGTLEQLEVSQDTADWLYVTVDGVSDINDGIEAINSAVLSGRFVVDEAIVALPLILAATGSGLDCALQFFEATFWSGVCIAAAPGCVLACTASCAVVGPACIICYTICTGGAVSACETAGNAWIQYDLLDCGRNSKLNRRDEPGDDEWDYYGWGDGF